MRQQWLWAVLAGMSWQAHGQAPAATPPASATAGTTVRALPAADVTFPRHVRTADGLLVIHEPQIDSWPDYRRLHARSAIEVTLKGSEKGIPGSLVFESDTRTDLEQRVVGLFNVEVTGVSFPGTDAATAKKLDQFVRTAVKPSPKKVPLDVVLAYVADGLVPQGDKGLSTTPPKIFYSDKPAVLVVLDGAPIKAPIQEIGLEYAVNTNWDLFWHAAGNQWYLLNGTQWLATPAADMLSGWIVTDRLPAPFSLLPADENWRTVRANVPPAASRAKAPKVFVSKVPAEIVVTNGRPDLTAIPGLELRYVTDTESDLFRLGTTYYFLASGRWFSTQDLKNGPWVLETNLPTAFAGIPKDSPKAHVRASVPGTEEARVAVLEASIPRTAVVKQGAAPTVQVTYTDGEPKFESIPGTTLSRAVNTPNDVLQYGSAYYLCLNAVWYVADTAKGPWRVATKVPDEIYKIPADSPAYHVTAVRIYESDAETVTTGYTSGYYGVYSTGVSVVFGTGWYYDPYYWYGPYYPYYYPYPVSYGRGAWYNPDTGRFTGAEAIYGPYGGAGRAAMYNPETGTYARGRAVWDSDEMAGQAIGYNPRTGTGVATSRYRSEDSYWGQTLVKRDDNWVYSQSDWQNGSGTTDFATSRGTTGTISGERQGDSIKTESEIQRKGETITGQGEWSKQGGSSSFESTGGASGTVNRDVGDGQITGGSTVNKGDKSVTTEMVRTEDGVARQVTTGSGDTTTFARGTGSDDLYAAKDGQVYKRTDDGWQKYSSDGWQPAKPDGGAEPRNMGSRDTSRDLPSPATTPSTPRNPDSYQDLNRDHRARESGNRQYQQRRSGYSGGMRGGGMRGGGRRR